MANYKKKLLMSGKSMKVTETELKQECWYYRGWISAFNLKDWILFIKKEEKKLYQNVLYHILSYYQILYRMTYFIIIIDIILWFFYVLFIKVKYKNT